ncbi:ABC transporter substrate-binding protein [Marinomonas mediterranea]|uniref:ABC transporter substrate-binding protein n=1 Tax=Marinomonas mediterranea TaxID=119864 RepID=UPI00234B6DB2|nr:ABC transporter substrate-binding protein [Marinomonas mediterranea]
MSDRDLPNRQMSDCNTSDKALKQSPLSRRKFLGGMGVALGSSVLPAGFTVFSSAARASSDPVIKIGFISPRSGPLSVFGEGDEFLVEQVMRQFSQGLTIDGVKYALDIIIGDTRSDSIGASLKAKELIDGDHIDFMLTSSTPETVNPVADACEAAGVPCLSTTAPWESFYFGRGGIPGQASPFKWTYHFCFGVMDFAQLYIDQWQKVDTNKRVGALLPNDADGNAIRGLLLPALEKEGFTVVDAGPYENGTSDFTQQINLFKKEKCEIFNTFPFPPDFPVFWRQAAQKGLAKRVKVAQLAKAGLFPAEIESMGKLGYGLHSGAYWHKDFPFTSLSTGLSCAEIADGFEKTMDKQWNQQVGANAALFDAAISALVQSNDPKNKVALATALSQLQADTAVGRVDFKNGPAPNCARAGLVGVQWMKSKQGPWPLELPIVSNANLPSVPLTGTMTRYKLGG